MRIFFRNATPLQLQLLIWGMLFLLNFLSYLPMDGAAQALIYSAMNSLFYAIIIYGNISVLFPRLYERGQIVGYVLVTTLLLVSVGAGRTLLSTWIYNHFFLKTKPEAVTLMTFLYFIFTSLVIYLLSFVFRIALAYFKLKRQAAQMLEQKSQAELNLLKSQIQPHFLFNTLNNIYYEAYREAPRTALLIGRLSDIMRYFVDESPKERVALSAEIKFLENYIALEEIRIRHGVKVEFEKTYEGDPFLPPMLLMTFVENIFKHGIDRGATGNHIRLSLLLHEGFLLFRTENALPRNPPFFGKEGSGLKNLQKRLTLLYENRFELSITRTETCFQARLKIPLA
jgi:sensor histidine kinase YesM